MEYYQKQKDNEKTTQEVREEIEQEEAMQGGTGTLIRTQFPYDKLKHWMVFTNYHVIYENEAEGAEVEFEYDYPHDSPNFRSRRYPVKEVVAHSTLPTKNIADINNVEKNKLDYSVLALEAAKDDTYLEGIYYDAHPLTKSDDYPQDWTSAYQSLPLVMFSHPLGKPKHISIGTFPNEITGEYPIAHIEHDLLTQKGSSGSAILCSPLGDAHYLTWNAVFSPSQ